MCKDAAAADGIGRVDEAKKEAESPKSPFANLKLDIDHFGQNIRRLSANFLQPNKDVAESKTPEVAELEAKYAAVLKFVEAKGLTAELN
eukprot:7343242-Prymnesium_polylepis.1